MRPVVDTTTAHRAELLPVAFRGELYVAEQTFNQDVFFHGHHYCILHCRMQALFEGLGGLIISPPNPEDKA
jgi:hypothetical protein